MKSGLHGNRWLGSGEEGKPSRQPEAPVRGRWCRPAVSGERMEGGERTLAGESRGRLDAGGREEGVLGQPAFKWPPRQAGPVHLCGSAPQSQIQVVEKVGVSCQPFDVGHLVPRCLPCLCRCILTSERAARKRNQGEAWRQSRGGGGRKGGWRRAGGLRVGPHL